MDFVKQFTGDNNNSNSENNKEGGENQSSGGGGGFMDSINNMAGGGKQGEKSEDGLDKAIDFVQEKVLGQGNQSNEGAGEQAKDEAISDFIRDKYKTTTGSEFPVEDKDKKFG